LAADHPDRTGLPHHPSHAERRLGGAKLAKPYKYKGILAKKRKPLPLVDENPTIENALRIVHDITRQALIRELFADCGAGQFNPFMEKGLGSAHAGWRKVALTLAERHVKGFQHAGNARKGRPEREDEREIWAAITLRLADGQHLRQAARLVAKERQKGESFDVIESAYRRFVRVYPQLDTRQKSR
jgi:hypothetical protein